ncbi:MAG: (2Fe-2S)-binding protein [Myxococcaceae bacterium]
MRVELHVNERHHFIEFPAGTNLLTILRDELGLTGAKFGCGQGQCGACVVLVDNEPLPACKLTVEDVVGRCVTTIEGLAPGGALHPVQRAFLNEGALQCGYCTSGMVLGAVALLRRNPTPSENDIREALAPHLCRCGVYLRAIHAVQRAAR